MCENPTEKCYLDECVMCKEKDITYLKDKITQKFESEDVEDIKFPQWENTDRSMLIYKTMNSSEFVDYLFRHLKQLKAHSFIAKKQSSFLDFKKENLQEGQVIIGGDFAENYAFIAQDAAQGYHWNRAAATIHPFIAYSKHNNEMKSISSACISDELEHSTEAVWSFQCVFIKYLKESLPFNIEEIIYFSDGCAAQYKSRKNFANLVNHAEDFGVPAEWHFFATSHGKGPYDGIGGTIKREAAYYSLKQTTENYILEPIDLYNFCVTHLKNIQVFFVTKEDIQENRRFLNERFRKAKTISGTRSFHSFKPIDNKKLEVKRFSFSESKFVKSPF